LIFKDLVGSSPIGQLKIWTLIWPMWDVSVSPKKNA